MDTDLSSGGISEPLEIEAPDLESRQVLPLLVTAPPNLSRRALVAVESGDSGSIPLLYLDETTDIPSPLSISEQNFGCGSSNGAVKVRIAPSLSSLFESTLILDPDSFTFFSTRQVVSSPHLEVQRRISFHNELVRFFQEDTVLPQQPDSSSIKSITAPHEALSAPAPSNLQYIHYPEIAVAASDSVNVLISSTPGISDEQSPNSVGLPATQKTLASASSNAECSSVPNPSVIYSKNGSESPNQSSQTHEDNISGPWNVQPSTILENKPCISNTSIVQNGCSSGDNLHKEEGLASRSSSAPELSRGDILNDLTLNRQVPVPHREVFEPEAVPTSKIGTPSFLQRLPTIDKKPVDLFNLFVAVNKRGGFQQVTCKKQWAQIGRELGYRGRIMTSLSSSLKSCYQKSIYPFELYMLANHPLSIKKFISESDSIDSKISASQSNISNGKDSLEEIVGERPLEQVLGKRLLEQETFYPIKRTKSGAQQVLRILGSTCYSRRSLSRRYSKGFFTNSPFTFDSSRSRNYNTKSSQEHSLAGKKPTESSEYNLTTSAQLQLMWDHMLKFDNYIQDEATCGHPQKVPQTTTLRQFMQRDLKVQDALVALIPELLTRPRKHEMQNGSVTIGKTGHMSIAEFELLYWEFAQKVGRSEQLKEILDPEICQGLSTLSHESNFCKPGNDILRSVIKRGLGIDSNDTCTSAAHGDFAKACAHPWNLHNVPTLPQSLLGYLDEGDFDDRSVIVPEIDVAMSFTTINWHRHDQYLQSINYLAHGAPRVWYFIPELDAAKFESFLEELNAISEAKESFNMRWTAKDLEKICRDGDGSYETLLNSLDCAIQPLREYRLQNKDAQFQNLIKGKRLQISTNLDIVITPQMLLDRGIKWTRSVQSVGDAIITYPGTYSCIVSTGFSLSEKIKFASPLWLPFSLKGSKIMQDQCMLPCFPLFKLVSNLVQLHESQPASGSPEYQRDLKSLYNLLYTREIELRTALRKLRLKEINIDERSNRDSEAFADDDLTSAYPSTVVITNNSTQESLSLSAQNFLDLLSKGFISLETITVELRTRISDEKLKVISRGLDAHTLDYKAWMRRYEDMMKLGRMISPKACRALLAEGEKINAASVLLHAKGPTITSEDETTLTSFGAYYSSLTNFLNEANNFIEECQSLLSIKHQSRIRRANEPGDGETVSHLTKIVEKIPQLNFYCVEMDQVIEFKLELENFDKAARLLVSKPHQNYKDFDELINLGHSFGLSLPSLSFMERISERLKWIEVFEVISRGADPYANKKDVFLLSDLNDFIDKGTRILAKEDEPLVERAKAIADDSVNFNAEISTILETEYIDHLDIEQLEAKTDRFGQGKLFLSTDVFTQLSRVYNNLAMIKQYQELTSNQMRMLYSEAKQLQHSIMESNLAFNKIAFGELFGKAEAWVDSVLSRIDISHIAMNSIPSDALATQSKSQLSSECAENLKLVLRHIEVEFSDLDRYDCSSSFSSATAITFDASDLSLPVRYCFCRGTEFGTMVECEECKEWYHLSCVALENDALREEEHYICVMCRDTLSWTDTDSLSFSLKISLSELQEFALEYHLLTVYPSTEGDYLRDLCAAARRAASTTKSQFEIIMADDAPSSRKLDKLRFWLRKLYGFAVMEKPLVSEFRSAIKRLALDTCQIAPPPDTADHLNSIENCGEP